MYTLKDRYYGIPDQELIDDLIAVAKKLGTHTLSTETYQQHGKYSDSTIKKRFGMWFTALEKAGLQPSRTPIEIDKKLLFENLGAVWRQLGEQPKFKHIRAPLSRYAGSVYLKYFDTWMTALRMFVEYENSKKPGSAKIERKPLALIDRSKKYIKAAADRRNVSPGLKYNVFLRDGFRCRACGRGPQSHPGIILHCDHIVPWSKGGRTRMDNLQTLCAECNLGKSSKMGI